MKLQLWLKIRVNEFVIRILYGLEYQSCGLLRVIFKKLETLQDETYYKFFNTPKRRHFFSRIFRRIQ